jgi:hypothetical protein
VPGKIRKRILASVVLVLLSVSIYKSLTIDDSRLHVGDLEVRSRWLKSNTPSSAVVMTGVPEVDFVYSGRKTIPYPLSSQSGDELYNYLLRNRVDYILIAPAIEWQDQLPHVPSYREATVHILGMLMELSSENRVTLVHASEQDLIRVFGVLGTQSSS